MLKDLICALSTYGTAMSRYHCTISLNRPKLSSCLYHSVLNLFNLSILDLQPTLPTLLQSTLGNLLFSSHHGALHSYRKPLKYHLNRVTIRLRQPIQLLDPTLPILPQSIPRSLQFSNLQGHLLELDANLSCYPCALHSLEATVLATA